MGYLPSYHKTKAEAVAACPDHGRAVKIGGHWVCLDARIARRVEIEKKICRAVTKALLAAGHSVSVHDGYEIVVRKSRSVSAVMAALMSTDQDGLWAHSADGSRVGWVSFVYGNDGWDVIHDYTPALEQVLAPAFDVAERAESGTI